MKLKLYFCSIRNKTTCPTNKKNCHEKRNYNRQENSKVYNKKKATETYKLYVKNDISTEGLNKEEWIEKETRRILDSIKWNLTNIK